MSEKIITLAEKSGNGKNWSIEDALKSAIDDIGKNGALKNGKKVLILALDDTDKNFSVSFIQAGLNMSQCLTVCEVAKTIFLQQMGYIE